MTTPHPAIPPSPAPPLCKPNKPNFARALRSIEPTALPVAPPVAAPTHALSIAQLEARADDLRQSIVRHEAQLKDPTLNGELNLTSQLEAMIDEADEDIAAIEAHIETREAEAATRATARKSYYSNTAYQDNVDTEYYGRGYVSSRGKNYRSCHVWRVGQPDQPVNESNEEFYHDDEGGDRFYDGDGEPRFVALCETKAVASALCALLNADDSILIPRPEAASAD